MRIQSLLVLLALVRLAVPGFAAGHAQHVVVVVWDGMRPDFVTEKNTPALWSLVQRGVFFQNHHPVYVSSTEVNGTAISTGAYPEHSSVIANIEYRPEINPAKPIGTETLSTVRDGDKKYGTYLLRPTLAEIIQRQGGRSVIAGAKPVALLHDRSERPPLAESITLFEGQTLPPSVLTNLTQLLGKFPAAPPEGQTKAARDRWTTMALVNPLWGERLPRFSILWLSEPDYSQHATSPGSGQSLAAIRSCDRNVARVLRALHDRGVEDQTDLFVVSDHGFSTIAATIDVAARLRTAGFDAISESKGKPRPGQVIVDSNGGAVLLYVIGHNPTETAEIVRFLQSTEFAGVIFTKQALPGTFRLQEAKLESPYAPDILFSMRWSDAANQYGARGLVFYDGDPQKHLHGMHVTLSPFDMQNTLIAAGPDFKTGVGDPLPTGNVDLAPTILWILGIKPPVPMNGRVLGEALAADSGNTDAVVHLKRLETTTTVGKNSRKQYLEISEVNGVLYFDQGNSFRTPEPLPFPTPPRYVPGRFVNSAAGKH